MEHLITREQMLLLGIIQNKGGTEFQAGARAELDPNPLTKSLASIQSQIVASVMRPVVNHVSAFNFLKIRIQAMAKAMIEAIPEGTEQPILVDIAAGFSPLSIYLATDLPDARIIELDRPETLNKRHARLQKSDIPLPPNLESRACDLSTTPLHTIFADDEKPDAIAITGAYLKPNELIPVLQYLHMVLSDKGAIVCYLPWRAGIDTIRSGQRVFKKQVGNFPTVMNSEEEITTLFSEAGYQDVKVVFPSHYAADLEILDIEILVVAHK